MTAGRAPVPLHLVFDWNGTLIDDLDLAVRSVNACAERFDVAPVDRERYRGLFGFPVQGFYARLGFDLDRVPWDELVATYLAGFDAAVAECPLHPGVAEGLERLGALDGVIVSVLSASYEPTLRRTLRHKGLERHFDHIVGIGDQQGRSKLEAAAALAAVPARRTVLVGDTTHDKEVADALGWATQLVSCGHQSAARLARLAVPVWPTAPDALAHLDGLPSPLGAPFPPPAPPSSPATDLLPEP